MIKVSLSQIQLTSTCVQLIGRVVYYFVDSAIEIKYKAEALDTKQYIIRYFTQFAFLSIARRLPGGLKCHIQKPAHHSKEVRLVS